MRRRELIFELIVNNPILRQLFGDWTDIGSPSFWRFFTNEKTLRSWDKVLRHITEQYKSPNVMMFKSDTKGMVLVLDHCVVRTYRTNLFLRIRPLYRLRNPYLEKCLMSKQLDHIGVFVCKKIKPLLDTSDFEEIKLSMKFTPSLFEKLLKDVEKAIGKIHSSGYCHHDISLDNTGYDEETKNFVVFDFDAAKRMTIFERDQLCLDRTSWERSLKAWQKFLPVK